MFKNERQNMETKNEITLAVLDNKLDTILTQVIETNGRVTRLEGWREKLDKKLYAIGAVGLTLTVIGSLFKVALETGLISWV
jgi:hypothetical protein